MNKYFLLLFLFVFFSQCSLDTKTGFWTKTQILEKKKESLEEIFESEEILKKEFNPNLKLRIKTNYTKNLLLII